MSWILADEQRTGLVSDVNALAMICDTLSRPCTTPSSLSSSTPCWQPNHLRALPRLYDELLRLQHSAEYGAHLLIDRPSHTHAHSSVLLLLCYV
jgi:hypothetical protein